MNNFAVGQYIGLAFDKVPFVARLFKGVTDYPYCVTNFI